MASSDTTGTTPTTPATPSSSCVLTGALTEGPYFVDEKLNRSDIRSDPTTGVVSTGVPLSLTFNVSRFASNACTPLTGAYLDVWHCDSSGTYSDVAGNGNGAGASGKKFLRGSCETLLYARRDLAEPPCDVAARVDRIV